MCSKKTSRQLSVQQLDSEFPNETDRGKVEWED